MQQREKKLLGAVLVLGALAGGYWLFGSVTGAINRRHTQISSLEGERNTKDTQIRMGKQAQAKLVEWEKRALPSDFEKARSAYSAWLRKIVDESGLGEAIVSPIQASTVYLKSGVRTARNAPRKSVYQKMPYNVTGTADHGELVKFLHAFYSSGHLHLIRTLTVTPDDDGKFKVKLVIDAIALPTADRKDTLTELQGEPLAGGKMEDYRDAIAKRNVFAAYKPEPPKPREDREKPKPDPAVDPAKFAKVTAIVTDPVLVVWIHVETSGKLFKLAEGQGFDLGDDRHVQVHRIHLASRTVELQLDEEKLQVALGQKLSEGKPMGNETAAR